MEGGRNTPGSRYPPAGGEGGQEQGAAAHALFEASRKAFHHALVSHHQTPTPHHEDTRTTPEQQHPRT